MRRVLQVLALAALSCGLSAAQSENTTVQYRNLTLDVDDPNQYSLLFHAEDKVYTVQQTNATISAFEEQNYTQIVVGQYRPTIEVEGWDVVYIAPERDLLDEANQSLAYYGAGYLEGYLTQRQLTNAGIVGAFATACAATPAVTVSVTTFVEKHIAHIRNASVVNASIPFYAQIGLLLDQLTGIADGYNAANNGLTSVTMNDVFALNFGEEFWDISQKYVNFPAQSVTVQGPGLAPRHCSALIKVTADDLYMAHDTWSSFESMRRMYKIYSFNTTVTMSAYPGTIASGDDWYMTSNKLAIQETTNEFYSTKLFEYIVPETISEFLRVMAATYLATSGQEWVNYFATQNSGTYNNQYMVVDMKLWHPGQSGASLQDDLLWVAEQIPGYVEAEDTTDVLRNQTYWPSFNVPYFEDIYVVSGFLEQERMQGSFWSYTKYARPEIFKRNQQSIDDLASMQSMMRYNQFATDPFSKIPNCSGCPDNMCTPQNSAMLTIASRGDLNPAVGTMVGNTTVCYGDAIQHFVSRRDHCATDSKIAAWSNFQNGSLLGIVISGPTAVNQTVFDFSQTNIALRPAGVPNRFDFGWFGYSIEVPTTPTSPVPTAPFRPPYHDIEHSNATLVAVVVAAAVVGFAIAAGALLYARKVRRQGDGQGAYRQLDEVRSDSRVVLDTEA
jgi:hypothetical protein